jgi:5-dehydro-2-deoxygluconokinase
MTVGYNKLLYILPFDHRGSCQSKMFGWKGTLTAEQSGEIATTEQVIYDGFKAVVAGGLALWSRPSMNCKTPASKLTCRR